MGWAILWCFSVVVSASAADPMHSELWGSHGEKWSADSRLPDFSYAGYQRGEKPLPTLLPSCSVKDFGAIGDGKTDDTRRPGKHSGASAPANHSPGPRVGDRT